MGAYGQYCPIAKAAEIVAERWTPLIIRELAAGSSRFNDLERGLPGISRSLLVQRLRYLQHTSIVERHPIGKGRVGEYRLTGAGQEMWQIVDKLGEWGVRWAFPEPSARELDPVLLLWFMRRRIDRDLLPPHRIVVQFDFRGAGRRTLWLLLERTDISVCLQHPGFETDLLVSADLNAFERVWFGRLTFAEAIRQGLIELDGPTALTRAFPNWLQLSHFAGLVKKVLAAAG